MNELPLNERHSNNRFKKPKGQAFGMAAQFLITTTNTLKNPSQSNRQSNFKSK